MRSKLFHDSIKQHGVEWGLNVARELCSKPDAPWPVAGLHCGKFPVQHDRTLEVFVWLAFAGLIATAIVGNACVLFTIYSSRSMHNAFNFFLANMACADGLMALLNAGTTWTYNFYYEWKFGGFCAVNHFVGVCLTSVSVFTMCVVSYDRCRAVVSPLRNRGMSRKAACLTILLVWAFGGLLSLPGTLHARVESRYYYSSDAHALDERRECTAEFDHNDYYNYLIFIVNYPVPLIIGAYTYTRIWLTLRRINLADESRVNVAGTHLNDKRKAVKMLGIVVSTFMLCWLPYQLYHLYADSLNLPMPLGIYGYLASYWLAMSACASNPLIYCVYSQRFRLGFLYAFRWLPGVHFSDEQQFSRSAASVRMRDVHAACSPCHMMRSASPTHKLIVPPSPASMRRSPS